jgi:uncharacterized membrane protein
MFDFLGPFHPQIVHIPVALLIFSAFFAIVGHAMDRDWLKKTAVLLLVVGFLGAFLAEQSGKPAHRVPEHDQGVPEEAIDEHQNAAAWVTRTAGGALLVLAIATRLKGGVRTAATGLALLLQVMTAVAVGRTAYLGGRLTYEHGANVKVDGQLVKSATAKPVPEGAPGHEHGAGTPPHSH